ncbi:MULTISPECIES: copper chaperone PCu(A)C [Vibrio]|uniref:copper chaperone PCu(A)C n=1 Tax=Vibrio TaxID=662 RepID=UPI0001B94F1B|nr:MULTISPECIES: copper chaperone PCu(A)C [Vibrio]EEX37517.1 metal-binding protein [Vibrio metschnikovii CIP 69.14]EKO3773289.1 copper chaperone PCu(A)C [Vibrio metschnikovii]MBC3616040.1 copper chaperone PCu(A)C [Vibrio metschnikovii]MBC3620186.1 copper chaperone PCu(A)C [Vibrio metschnikovii]MBC5811755.1 copper chaperone PCu(A)C [Vibrio metschnikovii]
MNRIVQLFIGVILLLVLATIVRHFTAESDAASSHHHAHHSLQDEQLIAIGKGLSIAEPKAKATIPGTKVSAGYLSLVNQSDSDIVFIAARSDAATHTELHHMVMENSRMSMRQVESITVPAHGQFDLTPGGYHIMFMDIATPFVAGQTVVVELIDDAQNVYPVELPVLDMSNNHTHAH